MCGFTGFIDSKATEKYQPERMLNGMAQTIKERGPDQAGVFFDVQSGLGMAHRRLSILDLSVSGQQPMQSANGRYVMVYNGEVYNYQTIRAELQAIGHSFKSTSDTEVVLAAISQFGLVRAAQKFIGMFALAVWDKQEQKLFLLRDRLGIKPLYWGVVNGVLFFGSQLKSFYQHPAWSFDLCRHAIASYLNHGQVAAPATIFNGVSQLKPAHLISIDLSFNVNEECYWPLANKLDKTTFAQKSLPEIELELQNNIEQAVCDRMIADVPLGAFLSGGIDSSLVVAFMQANNATAVNTYSIGYDVAEYDESRFAAKIAKHLGTNHHQKIVTEDDLIALIPRVPEFYDEPFADSSQLPTMLVSEFAREQVTVALTGDGGDELFSGYTRYHQVERLRNFNHRFPARLRSMATRILKQVPPQRWTKVARLLPYLNQYQHFGDKLYKACSIVEHSQAVDIYNNMLSLWYGEPLPLQSELPNRATNSPTSLHACEHYAWQDLHDYLPNDILCKVDRASMAYSLEARVPLLDHRVVELAWNIPFEYKLRDGKSKWILRQLLYKHVPQQLIDRPKMGFGVPIDTWLRGKLKSWAANLLSEESLARHNLFDYPLIKQKWDEHQSGHRNWQAPLWSVLMFQLWHQYWIK